MLLISKIRNYERVLMSSGQMRTSGRGLPPSWSDSTVARQILGTIFFLYQHDAEGCRACATFFTDRKCAGFGFVLVPMDVRMILHAGAISFSGRSEGRSYEYEDIQSREQNAGLLAGFSCSQSALEIRSSSVW